MDLFFFSSSFSLITSSVLYAALPRFQRAAFRGISSSRFFPASIKRSRTLGMVRVFFFCLSFSSFLSFFPVFSPSYLSISQIVNGSDSIIIAIFFSPILLSGFTKRSTKSHYLYRNTG